MQPDNLAALVALQQSFERLGFPLQAMDCLRLLTVGVDGEHHAAIQQLLIDIDGRCGEEHHYRAFHAVLLRHQLARRRVLAGRSDAEHAFALQELQRVCSAAGAFLFHDGQHLML